MEYYIKSIYIKGYKKFKNFYIDFRPGLNILIGENSAGKSTILEAINIVLNQSLFGGYEEAVQQQMNIQEIQKFENKDNRKIDDLPSIEIEIELNLDYSMKNQKFCGINYNLLPKEKDNLEKFGVKFDFSFDNTNMSENDIFSLLNQNNDIIPIEYYHAVWTTFAGYPYRRINNPLNSILIDSSINSKDIYGNYARNLYRSRISEENQRKLSYDFANGINKVLKKNKKLLDMGDNRLFSVDEQKSKINSLIEIQENNISLRNLGKGEENIVKTSLSLKKKSNLSLILLEEPESHLSYSNTRKQIAKIQENETSVKQIILTTHESMILNELNLTRAIWIKDQKGQCLNDLPEEDAQYFSKVDNFDILRYVLGNRIILVEGASEYILLPSIIKYALKKDLDRDKISIISMRGIAYNHFIKLSDIVDKKTLVLTDNDGIKEKVEAIKVLNKKTFFISMPKDINQFTLEVTIYNKNKNLCKKIIDKITKRPLKNTKYNSYENLPITLAAMLSRKTEFALELSKELEQGASFNTPDYIKKGVEWLVS